MIKEFLDDDPDKLTAWKWIKGISMAAVAAIGIFSSIYTVPADSVGVVQRFGKCIRQENPGIHLRLPFGLEEVTKVPVQQVQKIECGFRTVKSGVNSEYIGIKEIEQGKVSNSDLGDLIAESGERVPPGVDRAAFAKELLKREYLILTGDLNMADLEWVVQYTIKDAKDYLFNVKEVGWTIRDCSQSVLRQLVGNGSIDEAITIGRADYESQGKELLQKMLDDYHTGVQVVKLVLQSSHPPERVRASFDGVNQAQQQKETKINEARKDYNEAVPKASGEAKGKIERAEGYALERVNTAKGDVLRFNGLYSQYKQNPAVTKQRLYFETMTKVLPEFDERWIVEQGDSSNLLKLLNLTPSGLPEQAIKGGTK